MLDFKTYPFSKIWVIQCPDWFVQSFIYLKEKMSILQTDTDCIDKDQALQIEINWLQQTRNEHLEMFINICVACKIFIFSVGPHMNC